eukprot:836098_1
MAQKESLYSHPRWTTMCQGAIDARKNDLDNVVMITGAYRRFILDTSTKLGVHPWSLTMLLPYGSFAAMQQLLWKICQKDAFPSGHSSDFRGKAGCCKTGLLLIIKNSLNKAHNGGSKTLALTGAVNCTQFESVAKEWQKELDRRSEETRKKSKSKRKNDNGSTVFDQTTETQRNND